MARAVIKAEQLTDEDVPYVHHVTDNMLRLADQSRLAMFKAAGRSWEATDQEVVDAWAAQLNGLARNIASDRLSLTVHVVRTNSRSPYPTGQFRCDFARHLENAYRSKLERQLYQNEIYISVQRRPATIIAKGLSAWLSRRRMIIEPEHELARHLEDAAATIQADLAPYGLRRLGTRAEGHHLYSEIAEALALILTNQYRKVPVVSGRLGRAIHNNRLIFGRESIEIRGDSRSYFAASLSLKEYPMETFAGLFDQLLAAPYYYTLAQGFGFLSKHDGADTLTRKQNQMAAAGDKALSQLEDLSAAADQLQSNAFVMGSHHLVLTVFADSIANLNKTVAQAKSDLADCGAVIAREDLGLQGAYWSMLPGNERRRPRPGAITSRNWAGMASLHAYPTGTTTGYWGTAAARFRTIGGTPYDFQFHVGDLANIAMFGPSGSGKTTLLLFLLAMAEKYRASTVFFDKDRGGEIFSRAVGGNYLVLPSGEPTGLAPLRGLTNTPRDIEFLTGWIAGLISGADYAPTPEDEGRISQGVRALFADSDPEQRSMAELRAFLGQRSTAGAAARLKKWCQGSALGWAFDSADDRTDLARPFVGYDMTAVLDDPEICSPAMAYMFHRVESLLDGRRVVIAIDEFWKTIANPAFCNMINDKLKTIRKLNGVVILATQSPRDALNSQISHSILEQCPTQIFTPNPRASESDYIDGMKLTPTEFRLVKDDMPRYHFLLKQGSDSVVCGLDLSAAPECISVLSGRKHTVALMERIIAQAGDHPDNWLDQFITEVKETVA